MITPEQVRTMLSSMDMQKIAVDLDGTLAYYDKWRGIQHIGEPIEPMLTRVKLWLAEGRTVVIFTARADDPAAIPYIEDWCVRHIGMKLIVTNIKTSDISEFWDDKAVGVEQNTGDVA